VRYLYSALNDAKSYSGAGPSGAEPSGAEPSGHGQLNLKPTQERAENCKNLTVTVFRYD